MKKILLIIAIVVVFFIGLDWGAEQFLKSAMIIGIKKITGTSVRINRFSFSLFRQAIEIKGLKFYHPRGYPKAVMVDMPRVGLKYDLFALFRRKVHLHSVEVDLKELVVIKNNEGQLNVDALKVAQRKEERSAEKTKKVSQKLIAMQVDELILSIGKVVYKDFSKSVDKPSIQVFELNVKERKYKNIVSAQQLIALVLVESMKPTAIKGAKIYGAATLLGTSFLPAGAAVILMSKDSSQAEFNTTYNKAYRVSLEIMRKIGKITREDKNIGLIKAKKDASDVTIKIISKDKVVQIAVSARKYLLPDADTARSILYEISEKLK